VLAVLGVAAIVLIANSQKKAEVGDAKAKPGDGSQTAFDWRSQLTKVSTPYRVQVGSKGFEIDAASISDDEWQMSVAEDSPKSGAPAFMVSKSGDKPLMYSVDYDSAKSRYKPAAGYGVKQIKFLAAKRDGVNDSDWALHVEGTSGRRLSIAGGNGKVVYDSSFGAQMPIKKVPGLTARYAYDVKRRSGSKRVLPSWVRQSVGLQYVNKLGDFKLNLLQKDPDTRQKGVDVEAAYRGALKMTGSPEYTLRAEQMGQSPTKCEGTLCVTGPYGTSGGVDITLMNGSSKLAGRGEFSGKRVVAKGVEVAANSKVVFTPVSQGNEQKIALDPISLKASADLAELLPDYAGMDSKLNVEAKYSIGSKRPSVSGSMEVNPTKLGALKVLAEGTVDTTGRPSGSIRFDGDIASGMANMTFLQKTKQAMIPAKLQNGKLVAKGRLAHTSGGKPRLQLGLEYTYDMGGNSVKLQAGDLPRAPDTPWVNPRAIMAKDDADKLRQRVESPEGLGQSWLRGWAR